MAIAIPQQINRAANQIYIRAPYTSTSSNHNLILEEEVVSSNHFTIRKEIQLSQRDFEYFTSRLFTNEEPNDDLKALAQRYKERLG